MQEEVGGLNGQVSELQSDVEGSREREAELLAFTEKLSSKNAQLQSEGNSLQGQLDQLQAHAAELQARLQDTQGLLEDKVRGIHITLCIQKVLDTYFIYYFSTLDALISQYRGIFLYLKVDILLINSCIL